MDKNAHYLAVGSFVIIVTIAGLMFGAWLYGDRSKDTAKHYEIHFSESVVNEHAVLTHFGIVTALSYAIIHCLLGSKLDAH
jgi:hypothetical protein